MGIEIDYESRIGITAERVEFEDGIISLVEGDIEESDEYIEMSFERAVLRQEGLFRVFNSLLEEMDAIDGGVAIFALAIVLNQIPEDEINRPLSEEHIAQFKAKICENMINTPEGVSLKTGSFMGDYQAAEPNFSLWFQECCIEEFDPCFISSLEAGAILGIESFSVRAKEEAASDK